MDKSLEQKILKCAIELLFTKDITKITTREIVKKADVNISLLHYYFKNKDELFLKALETVMTKPHREWLKKEIDFNSPEVGDLEKYWVLIMENIYNYPTVARTKIHLLLKGYDIDSLSLSAARDLKRLLTKLLPELSEERISLKVNLIGAANNSYRITRKGIVDINGIDISNNDIRFDYYKKLLMEIVPELYRREN